MSPERAVSPVIGVILIVGIVLTVAVTVAAFGAAMIQDTQSSIEHSQTETAFSQLAVDASELRENGSEKEFELGHQDGQVRTVNNTGNLAVELQEGGNTTPLSTTSLNSLVYERDGKQIAYQGGGVFRKQGEGSSLVSAPEFFYRDNSLVFPVTVLEGDVRKSGTLDGSLKLSGTKQIYPNESDGMDNPLDAGTLYIRVQSEYCQGWEEYFESQTRGAVAEECSENTDDGDIPEVKVELSVPFELESGTIQNAVKTQNYEDNDLLGVEEGDMDVPMPDMLIQQKSGQCNRVDKTEWGLDDPVNESGLYCVEKINSGYEFNTASIPDDEEIEVYVDGDVEVGGKGLPVNAPTSDETQVTLYINGSFDMEGKGGGGNTRQIGNDNDPTQTHIFVSSDGDVGSPDGSATKGNVDALLYAPGSDAHFQSRLDFEGAMIVETLSTQGIKDSYVSFDPAMSSMQIKHEGAGPEFYYLHLVEKTMTIQS